MSPPFFRIGYQNPDSKNNPAFTELICQVSFPKAQILLPSSWVLRGSQPQTQTTPRNRPLPMNPQKILCNIWVTRQDFLFRVVYFGDLVAPCVFGPLFGPPCSNKPICPGFKSWVRVLMPPTLKVFKFLLRID